MVINSTVHTKYEHMHAMHTTIARTVYAIIRLFDIWFRHLIVDITPSSTPPKRIKVKMNIQQTMMMFAYTSLFFQIVDYKTSIAANMRLVCVRSLQVLPSLLSHPFVESNLWASFMLSAMRLCLFVSSMCSIDESRKLHFFFIFLYFSVVVVVVVSLFVLSHWIHELWNTFDIMIMAHN